MFSPGGEDSPEGAEGGAASFYDGVRGFGDAPNPRDKIQLSTEWRALLDASSPVVPWIHGYGIHHRADGTAIGSCGFKGPPGTDGQVEIAYGIAPEQQGRGYATEAVTALVRHAFNHDTVRLVRAHTLPQANASARVLTKCGFHHTCEVLDPGDGLVWRWEISVSPP